MKNILSADHLRINIEDFFSQRRFREKCNLFLVRVFWIVVDSNDFHPYCIGQVITIGNGSFASFLLQARKVVNSEMITFKMDFNPDDFGRKIVEQAQSKIRSKL